MSRFGRRYKVNKDFRRPPFVVVIVVAAPAAPVVLAFADGSVVTFSNGALVAL